MEFPRLLKLSPINCPTTSLTMHPNLAWKRLTGLSLNQLSSDRRDAIRQLVEQAFLTFPHQGIGWFSGGGGFGSQCLCIARRSHSFYRRTDWFVESDAGILAVFAHEYGHVVERHLLRRPCKTPQSRFSPSSLSVKPPIPFRNLSMRFPLYSCTMHTRENSSWRLMIMLSKCSPMPVFPPIYLGMLFTGFPKNTRETQA